jgi:hypothetical protein
MRMRPIGVLVMILGLFVGLGPAAADTRFHNVPGKRTDGGRLQVKVVEYDGSTNGKLTVRVRNTGTAAAKFAANGLYFVPDGDPDQAPQRLGAVGPMEIAGQRQESVTVGAGASVTLTLDVFCIDSHRSSPTSTTPFTVGKTRMPANLTRDIDRHAKKAADKAGGFAAPAATGAVQSEVWKTRDARWIALDGEGDQEADK